MEELLLIARREFTELPKAKRHSPARIRNVQPRFYIDRYAEHEKAFNLLAQQVHGEGPKTLVRALLHYRDTVHRPLERLGRKREVPKELQVGVLDFTPRADTGNRVKTVGVRLYIDRYVEHREAFEFLQEIQQRLRGDGNKIIVKALIHYIDTVLTPLQRGRRK